MHKRTAMDYTEEQILEELKNNPKVQAFIATYNDRSTALFLHEYAKTKVTLLTEGENLRKRQLHADQYYRTKAEDTIG